MQAVDEDVGLRAGAGGSLSDPEDQGGPAGPDSRGPPGVLEGHAGPGGPQCRGDLGASDNQGGASGLGGPGDGEGMRSAAVGAPTEAGAAQASGPRRDAASSVAVRPRNRKMVFKLRVHFRCPVEAEIARRAMDQPLQHHQPTVRIELKVKGSVFAIKWAAEDPGLLQVSVNAFLDKFCVVMRNIRCIWP
ncbi:EKC/KEOPS complex subunit LAGE3-like [Saccopteryx leptura]|uniref:EKC/KEOPS complex subunit LAGE3-like n=1 Tax=Saccopteryx leptura TaxID=249018 RepID=UPI00339C4417